LLRLRLAIRLLRGNTVAGGLARGDAKNADVSVGATLGSRAGAGGTPSPRAAARPAVPTGRVSSAVCAASNGGPLILRAN